LIYAACTVAVDIERNRQIMTYCVAISTNTGMVFCSDSRTNAGTDVLFSHSKMHVYNNMPDRMFIMLTAGNLATTQAITARVEQDMSNPEAAINLRTTTSMTEAAKYICQVNREEQARAQESTAASGIDTSASLLFGGQIQGARHKIYMMYSAGNFITDSDDTPFLQVGENKYGKPILDRIITRDTSLEDAARCALVSMDSTIRSNATVGPPIEVLVYEKDSFKSNHYIRLEGEDPYLLEIRQRWNEALKTAFAGLPQFEWEKRSSTSDNILPINPDQTY
jgi:putative proteasome-type protease